MNVRRFWSRGGVCCFCRIDILEYEIERNGDVSYLKFLIFFNKILFVVEVIYCVFC